MKWISFSWIQPLQGRVKTELPPEKSSFLKALSIITPILIYYAVNSFGIILFAYFMRWISVQSGSWSVLAEILRKYSSMVSGIVNGLSMLLGAGAVTVFFLKETPRILLPDSHKKDIPLLLLLGASSALCLNILFGLLHITASSEAYSEVADRQFALPLWAGIVLYGLISPVAEEIVFRGLVYNRLCRQFGLPFAIIGSSFLFGIYHGNAVQALYGFILGLLIAVLYEKYASFVVPVLLHGAANICVYVITSDISLSKELMTSQLCVAGGVLTVCLFLLLVFHKEK